ncbi:glycosyl transferase, partial [Klebsiella pneumoniae]
DIIWTVHLAANNGRFCTLDIKDYIYINNKASITHRPDYYDVRAISYVEVITEIIQVAEQEENKKNKGIFVPACASRGSSLFGVISEKGYG